MKNKKKDSATVAIEPPSAEVVKDLVSKSDGGFKFVASKPMDDEKKVYGIFFEIPHPQEQIACLTNKGFLTPEETVDFFMEYLSHKHTPTYKQFMDGKAKFGSGKDCEGNFCPVFDFEIGQEYSNIELGANFEVSGKTHLKHMHIAVYFPKTQHSWEWFRQLLFPFFAHFKTCDGHRNNLTAYMNKEGKHQEKGSVVVVPPKWTGGGVRTRVNTYDEIARMLAEGMTPDEICKQDVRFAVHRQAIEHTYYLRKIDQIPDERDVFVEYHFGATDAGKTWFCRNIASQYLGRPKETFGDFSKVAYSISAASYKNAFDNYSYQPLLVITEFRDSYIRWDNFLTLLDRYTEYVSARYSNKITAWDHVAINGIQPLENLYKQMTSDDDEYLNRDGTKPTAEDMQRRYENRNQLWRRINKVVYHFVDDAFPDDDERHYCEVTVEGGKHGVVDVYKGVKQMKDLADEFLRQRHPERALTDAVEVESDDDELIDMGVLDDYMSLFGGSTSQKPSEAVISPQKASQGFSLHVRSNPTPAPTNARARRTRRAGS